MTDPSVLYQLHTSLQLAAQRCSERCLYQSAKWAAELLASLQPLNLPAKTPTPYPFVTTYHPPTSPAPQELQLEFAELSTYILAKSYFDCREFDRCYSTLKNCQSSKSRFLCQYARYMAGEKRKEEDMEMVLGPLDGAPTPNRELLPVIAALEAIFEEWKAEGKHGREKEEDSWLLYLYGIVLGRQGNEEAAKKALLRSVSIYPWNWGAWLELGHMIGTLDELNEIVPHLPNHVMTNMFHLYSTVELYQFSESVHSELTALEAMFPNSPFLKTQRALLYYHGRDFEEAEQIFDNLLKADPHRLDALDHYSNILYVMERRPKLGFLAQLASTTDRFRPETCCVVGNYYSLKSEHEKAVMYFRRALTLDRSFLSAWTLMGHEYVEMKNTHAAIEAYRRAVDVNRKDYRAWYGLGLSYEVLEMHYYALFYFQRAASLRPYDPSMWQAMGSCFDKMNRPHEAIKAYKRALVSSSTIMSQHSSPNAQEKDKGKEPEKDTHQQHQQQQQPVSGSFDPSTLYSIALLYVKLEKTAEAAKYMEMCLREEELSLSNPNPNNDYGGPGFTNAVNKARLWLARWEFERGNLGRCLELGEELVEGGSLGQGELEEAKALVRDVRSRLEAGGAKG